MCKINIPACATRVAVLCRGIFRHSAADGGSIIVIGVYVTGLEAGARVNTAYRWPLSTMYINSLIQGVSSLPLDWYPNPSKSSFIENF